MSHVASSRDSRTRKDRTRAEQRASERRREGGRKDGKVEDEEGGRTRRDGGRWKREGRRSKSGRGENSWKHDIAGQISGPWKAISLIRADVRGSYSGLCWIGTRSAEKNSAPPNRNQICPSYDSSRSRRRGKNAERYTAREKERKTEFLAGRQLIGDSSLSLLLCPADGRR